MGYFKNEFEYQQFLQKKQEARKREVEHDTGGPPPDMEGVDEEMKLHKAIMDHCKQQWPRWLYIRARSDQPSTIGVGVHDFTVFLPNRIVVCVECKKRGAKPSEPQRNWIHQMKLLGHDVHIVRTLEGFLTAAAAAMVGLKVTLEDPGKPSV